MSRDSDAARRYYRQREAQRRARREQERQQWAQRVRQAVARLAPQYPEVREVYLFGSLAQPGRFRPDSDIDLAIRCDSLEAESRFWRALEQELQRDVDLRPLTGAVKDAVAYGGERIHG